MKQKIEQNNQNKTLEEKKENDNLNNENINNNTKEKIKNIYKKVTPILEKVIIVLIPFIITLFIECFYMALNAGTFLPEIINRKAFAFSVLLIYIIYIILLGLTKKTSTTVNILLVFTYIILLINQIKIIYTGEPIAISDVNF